MTNTQLWASHSLKAVTGYNILAEWCIQLQTDPDFFT